MPDKPQHADEYRPEQTQAAEDACAILATRLGAVLDELVIVGGLVPTLLIDSQSSSREPGDGPHVGTADLDIGVSLAMLDDQRYRQIADGLRAAGFGPDENDQGNATSQRWRSGTGVTVDFLIPPTRDVAEGGHLQNLERDFAAVVTPGLDLAFEDREQVEFERVVSGERIVRSVWVCGPGAYVVLKALAFDGRGEPKDAYDLYYVLTRYGAGTENVAERMIPLLNHPEARRALEVLERDFSNLDGPGPVRVARFLTGAPDEAVQADVAGAVRELVQLVQPGNGGSSASQS